MLVFLFKCEQCILVAKPSGNEMKMPAGLKTTAKISDCLTGESKYQQMTF